MSTTTTPHPADLTADVLDMTEESMKSVQDLFDSTVGQVRQFVDTVADATLSSIKRNQEVAQKTVSTVSGLVSDGFDGCSYTSLPTFDINETMQAGFELAKNLLDSQRELAERLIGAVSNPAA